jgi:hypothetical protein
MLNAIPIKIQMEFFNLKVHMKAQKTSNSQSNPEPKEQGWRYHNT